MLSQLTIYLVYYYVILRTCCLTLHYVTLRDLIAYHMSCYLKLYKAALFYLKSAMRRCTNLLYALLFHGYITVIACVKELKSTGVKHIVSDIVCQVSSVKVQGSSDLPGDSDPGVQIIELRRAQGNLFVLFLVCRCHFQFKQLFFQSFHLGFLLLN